MAKESFAEQCMCCHNQGVRVGLPSGNPAKCAVLCGVHQNQVKKRLRPIESIWLLTRRDIRARLGFIYIDAD
jgi:hypothetical protein